MAGEVLLANVKHQIHKRAMRVFCVTCAWVPNSELTAEKISATEMLRIGYLTSVVPVEALDEEVDRLATVLADNAPIAMRGMKRTIHEIARGRLDEEAADRRHRDSMRGEEIKEGIRAFSEKRPPKF